MLAPDSLVLDGRFRVLSRLGGGGMGDVYLAEQVSLGRRVALKVLRQDLSLQPGMSERFKREARLLSSVDHPAVVRVIDFGQSASASCLVMELVEGQTLHEALEAGPLTPTRAVPLFIQLSEGLAAIHEKGIIHRDLKPENVVLTRSARGEQARLLDFGIARLAEPDRNEPGVSQVGLVLGTPEYLSPEQAMGHKLDARSDLYSYGVLIFKTLAGTLPFDGPAPRHYLAQHVATAPRALADAAPQLARYKKLCAAVMRCLAKEPSARPQTAEQFRRMLEDAQKELPRISGEVPIPLVDVSGPAPSSGTASFGTAIPAPAPSPSTGALVSGSNLAVGRARNLTVMLTDIKGFTERTSHQTREENAKMLEEHDRLLLPVVKGYRGKLIQKRGDALLVVFDSPTEAVLCGQAIQDRLWRRNSPLPDEAKLRVRVAIHLGEVLVERDGLVGEPVQVVAAVEGVAQADEVVFTEAVNLSMNRTEVPAEEYGTVETPGRGESLRLYKCVPRSDGGPPFGGRDLQPLAGSFDVLGAVRGFRHRRAAAFGVALVGLLAAAAALFSGRDRAAKEARAALDRGEPEAALAIVERAERDKGGKPAELELLKAAALHGLDRHRDEAAVLKTTPLGDADARALAGAAEDFGEGDTDFRKILEGAPRGPIRELASGPPNGAQFGAVRFLDVAKAPAGELVEGYIVALRGESCRAKGLAARRLGELGDGDAIKPLEALAATPRETVAVIIQRNCGQDEAAAALKKLKK